ncbi:MAG: hypothetical protein D6696_02965, partial [Acidobacteria bacterium]
MMKTTIKLLAVAAILLLAAPAFAGGPLNLNPNEPDNQERWGNGGLGIPYQPDLGGLGPLDNATAVALVDDAYQTWADIPTSTATYSNNGPILIGGVPTDVDETNFCPFISNLFFGTNVADGQSPIVFDEDGAIFTLLFGAGTGVLGFASPDTRDANGVPIEGVSFLNGGSILGGFPVSDFFGVMVHEFGHYSGLAHTVVNGQNIAFGDASGPSPFNTFGNAPLDQVETMYPFAIIGGGEATPHADDVGALTNLYPSAAASGLCTITGSILAANGTPLTGVNVIAREMLNPFVDAASSISGDRGVAGAYHITVPPGEYTIHTDQILQGGFSTPPITLPGPEEFWNGANESSDGAADDPSEFVKVTCSAGATVSGIDVVFNRPAPGAPLPLGDDDSIELFMPFTFCIAGQPFDSVFVNSNGSLTFGSGDADFTESTGEMLSGPPRIAGLWDDLSPNNGGTVFFDETAETFTVNFVDVPEFFNFGANTFSITLHDNSDDDS